MQDISRLGSGGVVLALVAITALGLLLRKRWRDSVLLLLAYGGGELTVSFLKSYFQRPRPAAPLALVHGYSLPSGHAFNIILICGFATYLLWPRCRGAWGRIAAPGGIRNPDRPGGIQPRLFTGPLAGRRSGRVRGGVSLAAYQQGSDHRRFPGSRPGPAGALRPRPWMAVPP